MLFSKFDQGDYNFETSQYKMILVYNSGMKGGRGYEILKEMLGVYIFLIFYFYFNFK